jgi:Ca2+-binding EF-hand superfamily protein
MSESALEDALVQHSTGPEEMGETGETTERLPFKSKLREIFDEFDDYGGGSIDIDELGEVMQRLGQQLSQAELLDIVMAVDTTDSGEIYWDDFYRVMSGTEVGGNDDPSELIVQAFAYFDTGGSGFLSAAQILEVQTGKEDRLEQADVDDLMATAKDNGWTNEDGLVDYKLFVQNLWRGAQPVGKD